MGREQRVLRFEPRQVSEARERERDRLRFLASRVSDEAHWAKILESCPTQEDRDSLEREVAPFLPFRRCGNAKCESGEPPLWVPVLLTRTIDGGPTSRAQLLIRVCTPCREKIRLGDVLTKDSWARIVDGHREAGRPAPILGLTTLTFDALQ